MRSAANMKTTQKLAALALVVATSVPAFAGGSELDTALAAMASAKGEAYLGARAKTLALPDAKAQLEAKLARADWTDASFVELSMATIALTHLAHPALVERANHLEGINPDHYLLRRRADPECARELVRLGPAAAGAVLELYLRTAEAALAPHVEKKGDRAKERIALREAIVIALAESKHPSALFVCRAVARDTNEPEAARVQAIHGLGTIGNAAAFAELSELRGDTSLPANLRHSALRGAARFATGEALDLLAKGLASDDAAERAAAITAVGTFGSAWGWESRGPEQAEQGLVLRDRAARLLVGAIARDAGAHGDALIEAISVVAHPGARGPLAELAKDSRPVVRDVATRALERLELVLEREASSK